MKQHIILILIILSHIQLFSQKTPKKTKSNKLYINKNQVFTKDSVALNGYYKIKYTDFLNDWKTEITHFKDGFRFGNSKILRFNKLEEEGTYTNGVKHGTWKKYFYNNGTLMVTTEYKNGLKNGKEFGKRISLGYFICNYVDGLIDGPLLKYNFRGYLESKEYYEKGEKIYKHTYDDLLNIIEEINFSKKSGNIVSQKRRKINNDIYIDSLYYNDDTKLAKESFSLSRTPFKVKKYKNNKLLSKKEITKQQDTTRLSGKNILTFHYDDYIHNKHKTVSIYCDDYYLISEIKKMFLNYSNLTYNFCSSDLPIPFLSFKELYLYVTNKKGGDIYEINYSRKEENLPEKCRKKMIRENDRLNTTY